jgi:hypothetical protein
MGRPLKSRRFAADILLCGRASEQCLWAAGNKAYPSRLYYSVVLTPNDWAGAGSGYIDISPSDGDGITGSDSFRNQLWVFKGPYKGSIHRISGTSPSGDDPFARSTFVNGIGAVNHNATAAFGNDLGFMWSDGTYNTLSGIQQYGDYTRTVSASRSIRWIREHVNRTKLSLGTGGQLAGIRRDPDDHPD